MLGTIDTLAARIRRHPRAHGGNVVALGRLLLEAKRLLPQGSFGEWFRHTQPGYSLRTARECMQATRRLAEFPNLHHLTPATVRLLCMRAVRTKPSIRTKVAELALRGKVRWADARAIVSDTDPTILYGRPGDRNESDGEALARRLIALITSPQVTSVMISMNRDSEDDECESVQLTIMSDQGPTSITRRALATAVAAAVGEEPLRRCPRCERELLPDAFSSGCRACKRCERGRLDAYKKRKRINPEAN